MSCWVYEGECLETPPEGYYGFIYMIVDDTGKQYIGKKAFVHNVKKTLSKRARSKAENPRLRVSRLTKDSGWLDYWGSCKPLLEYIKEKGTEGFERGILKLCKDKQSLAYWELAFLVKKEVLFRDTWNGNISGKFFKNKIHE